MKVRLGVVDQGLVEFHLRFVLKDRPFCRVGLLLRRGIRLDEVRISFLVQARIREKRFILRLLRDGLVVSGLIESRVHDSEDIAFLDVLALVVGHIGQAAAHLGADGRRIEGLNGSNAAQIDRNIVGSRLLREDREEPFASAKCLAGLPGAPVIPCGAPSAPACGGKMRSLYTKAIRPPVTNKKMR